MTTITLNLVLLFDVIMAWTFLNDVLITLVYGICHFLIMFFVTHPGLWQAREAPGEQLFDFESDEERVQPQLREQLLRPALAQVHRPLPLRYLRQRLWRAPERFGEKFFKSEKQRQGILWRRIGTIDLLVLTSSSRCSLYWIFPLL